MIAIIDYGMGNVRSVYNALEYIGEEAVITADSQEINQAERLILPGVGAFADAMEQLRQRGLITALEKAVLEDEKPFLGICLGMQLLAEWGNEYGRHRGLGWITGEVVKMDVDDFGLKVPHVGWNDIRPTEHSPMFKGLNKQHSAFYFVHSYQFITQALEDVAAVCEYGRPFTAAILRNNIWGTQFHPEKSQDNGIQLLENFVNWRP